MSALAIVARWSFSKKKPMDAFKHFLEMDAGASVRQAPHQKDRKYIHVEISENFKKQQQNRKQLRLEQLRTKKILLQQKLSTQSKLLGNENDLENINSEIKSLEDILSVQEKELAKVQNALEKSESQYLLVEGYQKLVVLNKIEHLKHTNYHPTGLVLHPQTLKIIENIHYLVNNNLPVSKYKLFEIMPQFFQKEINELEQSMRRLIQQKKFNPDTSPSSRIRFFSRHSRRFVDPQQGLIDLDEERQNVFDNMQEEIYKMMRPHHAYVQLVNSGNTPFRSFHHMVTTFLSTKLQLKLLPQEIQLQETLRKIMDLKQKFHIYSLDIQQKKVKQRHKYVQPPEWIKNHPVLLERYDKSMVKFMNPLPWKNLIPQSGDDGGRAYLEEKLNQMVSEKYDPVFQQLWNSGRREELIAMKKKFQIDFLNDSTRILEEYNALQLQQKQKEEFLKIPKRKREIEQKKYSTLKLDDLTKTIQLNNSNPKKYTLPFFTNYFGIQNEQEARKLFNSFSYLRVHLQPQKSQQIKFDIIKFQA